MESVRYKECLLCTSRCFTVRYKKLHHTTMLKIIGQTVGHCFETKGTTKTTLLKNFPATTVHEKFQWEISLSDFYRKIILKRETLENEMFVI